MNDLNIRERRSGDVTVLDMNGRMRIGDDAIALRNSIRVLVKEEKTKILLNLAGVTHIDSCGLAELISGHMSLNKSGGVIKLVHLTKRVRELMTITKLVTVFDIYDDEPEAVASFQG